MRGRVALVSGGAGGIGRAVSLELAARGAAVGVADLGSGGEQLAASIRAGGGQALGVELDVTSSQSVAEGVGALRDELGAVDVLVNCAGWDRLRPFLETDEAFWRRVVEINFLGTLRTTHATLPAMVERGWGRIVNIGSDAGRVGSSLESVYSGAKGGVIAFTKTIAREVARRGVTANTVCPGPTNTPMLEQVVADQEEAGRVMEAMTRAVPMKRLAEPQDVATAVCFLASESAGYVTGQTLSVSGGLTMA